MNNDVIAQRIADAVLMNAVGRIASTYGLVLVPASDASSSESASHAPSGEQSQDEPPTDTDAASQI